MMNSITKIVLAAILGLSANAKALGEGDAKYRALSTHNFERVTSQPRTHSSGGAPMGLKGTHSSGRAPMGLKGHRRHNRSKFFDQDDAYFLGHCRVRDADGAKKGSV